MVVNGCNPQPLPSSSLLLSLILPPVASLSSSAILGNKTSVFVFDPLHTIELLLKKKKTGFREGRLLLFAPIRITHPTLFYTHTYTYIHTPNPLVTHTPLAFFMSSYCGLPLRSLVHMFLIVCYVFFLSAVVPLFCRIASGIKCKCNTNVSL